MTVKIFVFTLIVPRRSCVSGLGSAAYFTVPLPVPLAPSVTTSHDTAGFAVHMQLLPVRTATEVSPETPSADI